MRRIVLINPDGTVHNLVYLENVEAVSANDDWKDLLFIDYTDWAPEDHPRTHWVYDIENGTWGNKEVVVPTPLDAPALVPLEEPVADELAGGNE